MSRFTGFTPNETFTPLPDGFLHLLKEIGDVAELKVTLYALWRVEHMEGSLHALPEKDFEGPVLGLDAEELQLGLKKAVERGTLLQSTRGSNVIYFINSPRGRAAAEAFEKGERQGSFEAFAGPREKPNIFKLYEENIGPLTPLIADTLKDAEMLYYAEWISDAIGLAVKNNKRNWKYIEAILKRWKDEGRAEKQDRRNDQEDSQQSVNRKIEQLRKRSGK
jgi:DNA replication protein